MIEAGIKQPLRFYDALEKQNFRREWVLKGLDKQSVLIMPENAIIPFQIRRKRSLAQVTTFNLYTYDVATNEFYYNLNILMLIPAPITNHLKIVQMQTSDNIVYFQTADLSSNLPCGLHYIHISDGINDFYSEVFMVVADFTDNSRVYAINYTDNFSVIGGNRIIKKANTFLIKKNNPF